MSNYPNKQEADFDLLPKVMVAPNGATKSKADHPALPVSIEEVVATAADCHGAGADGLHAHVRDSDSRHVLDSGLYRELLAEMAARVPHMAVQITTEAVCRYTPDEQIALVRDVMPEMVSCAWRELAAESNKQAADFYRWAAEAGIAVQHILYEPQEVSRLFSLIDSNAGEAVPVQLLFVLGRYSDDQQSDPAMLEPFLAALQHQSSKYEVDWAVCAFGRNETLCLKHAAQKGGKVRVGFENNLLMADGRLAQDNAARVREVVEALAK